MKVEKGKYYMAGNYHAWKCFTLAKKTVKGTVLVRWETGFLKGKPARISVADMKECGSGD